MIADNRGVSTVDPAQAGAPGRVRKVNSAARDDVAPGRVSDIYPFGGVRAEV